VEKTLKKKLHRGWVKNDEKKNEKCLCPKFTNWYTPSLGDRKLGKYLSILKCNIDRLRITGDA